MTTLRHWNPALLHVQDFPTNTDFVDSQCLEPSDSRSSLSKWRNTVVTVLEIDTAKSLPHREWAWIGIDFFSFVGNDSPCAKECLFWNKGERACMSFFCTKSCPSFFTAWVTLLSSEGPLLFDSWILSCNSLLDLTSALWLWISFTKRSVSVDITTWVVSLGLQIDGIATSIPYLSRIYTIWTSRTGLIIVPAGIAAQIRLFG